MTYRLGSEGKERYEYAKLAEVAAFRFANLFPVRFSTLSVAASNPNPKMELSDFQLAVGVSPQECWEIAPSWTPCRRLRPL